MSLLSFSSKPSESSASVKAIIQTQDRLIKRIKKLKEKHEKLDIAIFDKRMSEYKVYASEKWEDLTQFKEGYQGLYIGNHGEFIDPERGVFNLSWTYKDNAFRTPYTIYNTENITITPSLEYKTIHLEVPKEVIILESLRNREDYFPQIWEFLKDPDYTEKEELIRYVGVFIKWLERNLTKILEKSEVIEEPVKLFDIFIRNGEIIEMSKYEGEDMDVFGNTLGRNEILYYVILDSINQPKEYIKFERSASGERKKTMFKR